MAEQRRQLESARESARESSDNEEALRELRGGARIAFILSDLFCETLRTVDPFAGVSDEDILMVISNANGHQPSLYVAPRPRPNDHVSFDVARVHPPLSVSREGVSGRGEETPPDPGLYRSFFHF